MKIKIIALIMTVALLAHVATLFCYAAEPTLSARSAVLMDAHSGSVLLEKNAYDRMGMASTTKLMTALTTVKLTDTSHTVIVAREAVGIEGSSVYLCEGERLTVEELLYALLLSSANDAAVALAVFCSGSVEDFVDKMNEYAYELGLEDTHFTNPHGLYDEQHYSTAYDMALIARQVLEDPLLREICSTYKKSLPFDSMPNGRLAVNHNKLLRSYEGAIGLKTGFTKKTGRCLVSAAQRDGFELICVTLDAPDDWRDHTAMLDWGYDSFERRTVAETGELEYEMDVTGGVDGKVTLYNEAPLVLTMPKGSTDYEVLVTSSNRFLFAPVKQDTLYGRVTVSNGFSSSSSSLRARRDVAPSYVKKGWFSGIANIFKD